MSAPIGSRSGLRKELAERFRDNCLILLSCAVMLGIVVFNLVRFWAHRPAGWVWIGLWITVAGLVIAVVPLAGQTIQMFRLLRATVGKRPRTEHP